VERDVTTIVDKTVKAVFDAYPAPMRGKLLALRAMIFAAAKDAGVGALSESLKWGQPSYRPLKNGVGTTVRIDALRGGERYALFVPCSTTLISSFREHYGQALTFEGKRAVLFSRDGKLPERAVKHCIAMALTYHARKGG
jgi:hypothetical protein